MAKPNIFKRLKRLFSTQVIVRNVGGRKLKIADTEHAQTVSRRYMADRFSRLYSNMGGTTARAESEFKAVQRLGLFRDYEEMDADSIIASALDIYSDESTMKSEYGKVLEIETEDDNIHDILQNLFYDILNIEFNLWSWVRSLCKYGDFFLYLDINEKYGITNVVPLSAYDLTRLEGEDPENPYYVKFQVEGQDNRFSMSYAQKEFENYEIAHFRMLADSNYLPYGRAMIEPARKVWKQLMLMEDAMLIHRIMRAPEKRVFKVDIGNIPPAEVDNFMQKLISKMKKAPYMDNTTGEYNLRYNMQNLTEDFFLPVRGGDSGTEIDNLSGLEFDAVDDIEYLRNKMLGSLKVPKAFLGYEEQIEGKATLAAEDVRFARTVERIQRIVVSELTKIAIVHLFAQGYRDQELVNFDLKLTNPSTIYEQEKVELWSNKVSLASSIVTDGLLSTDWIYKNVFKFTDEQIKEMDEQIIFDYKTKYRRGQIEGEGVDPAKEQEKTDAPEMGRTGKELSGKVGRPKEGSKYSKDGSARGRDPIGKHDRSVSVKNPDRSIKHTYKGASPLALAHYKSLKKSLGKISNDDKKILIETAEVEKEYKDEVSSNGNN